MNADALARGHDRIVPADGDERDEPIVIDVADHETDLVDMADQGNARSTVRVERGDRIAVEVGAQGCRRTLDPAPPDGAGGGLVTGWAGGLDQFFEEG